MSEAVKWLLLEVGILVALIPGVIAFLQWRRRRRLVQALHALSQQVKQSEGERKRTLTGILTGAHRLPEALSAELAASLIRSERSFFRLCFSTLLSQEPDAIEHLKQNLYNVLDDYLRKCATDVERAAPLAETAAPRTDLDDLFAEAESSLTDEVTTPASAIPAGVAAPPMPDEEIDWDAAFAELHEEKTLLNPAVPGIQPAEVPDKPDVEFDQETMDRLLQSAADEALPSAEPAAPEADSEADLMAQWGAALEEQAAPPAKPAEANPEFDLGWDDAFLEETLAVKPEKKPAEKTPES